MNCSCSDLVTLINVFGQKWGRYLTFLRDFKSFIVNVSYNALERRENSKGGKEVGKKIVSSQSSNKSAPIAPKAHNARKPDLPPPVSATNQSVKVARPTSSGEPAYEKQVTRSIIHCISTKRSLVLPSGEEKVKFMLMLQITELKLSVDGLEKERDFYFAKLRDIEILCQSPEIENLPVPFLI